MLRAGIASNVNALSVHNCLADVCGILRFHYRGIYLLHFHDWYQLFTFKFPLHVSWVFALSQLYHCWLCYPLNSSLNLIFSGYQAPPEALQCLYFDPQSIFRSLVVNIWYYPQAGCVSEIFQRFWFLKLHIRVVNLNWLIFGVGMNWLLSHGCEEYCLGQTILAFGLVVQHEACFIYVLWISSASDYNFLYRWTRLSEKYSWCSQTAILVE